MILLFTKVVIEVVIAQYSIFFVEVTKMNETGKKLIHKLRFSKISQSVVRT